MSTIDHINELRAELNACFFTKEERIEVEAELAALIAERDIAERAADAFLASLHQQEAQR